MRAEFNNGLLTAFLEGHIDSANSMVMEREIDELLDKYQPEALVLDAISLEYISSAGLRVVLKLRKRFFDLKITNVSRSVYEIFDMTGFTELVEIEKAYRTFDISGCELVGEGANGKVYRVNSDTIVKVYKHAESLEDIKREHDLSRTAFLLGIPTAIPYDVVKVGDSYGSVFELLNAKSFDELLREDPSKLEFVAQESMEIAKQMHDTPAPSSLPKQSDVSKEWIDMVDGYFTDEQYQKLKDLIFSIPETGSMLHGDLHIKNIMLQNNETLLIDMDTLTMGHPIYELAFIYNAYKGFGIVDPADVERFLKIPAELAYRLLRRSLEIYLDTDDQARVDEVEQKASLIGILRVMRRVIRIGDDNTPEGKKIVDTCRDYIADLLTRLDTLTF